MPPDDDDQSAAHLLGADEQIDPDSLESALKSFQRGSFKAMGELIGGPNETSVELVQAIGTVVQLYAQTGAAPPSRIGPFTIIRTLGRGGMGIVYEARQPSTGRTVALKVIRRLGSTDDWETSVYRREVRTLSRLQHPHIAAMYEAGQSPEGDHYFAMELVSGRTLTSLTPSDDARPDQSVPSLRDRIVFFAKTCRAIYYAHQRGVIHCDLKPSNIYVDDRGEPKILDFGLARLVDPDAAASLASRESAQIVGTLPYLSPEQARGEVEAIDTRSDVYGLGVVLYELLTGRLPYGGRNVKLAQALHNACNVQPARPSSVDGTLPRDIDSVLLKCLEKDPDRRYQSATDLAEDLDRFLTNRPVSARPAGFWYHARKFVARNKLASSFALVLSGLLAVFSGVYINQARQVTHERDEAQLQARRAHRTSEYSTRMLAGVHPDEVGSAVPVRTIFERASQTLDQELANDPPTLAAVHDALGRGYAALFDFERAKTHLQRALEIWEKEYGRQSVEYAATLQQMGFHGIRLSNGRREPVVRQAYEIRKNVFGDQSLEAADGMIALAEILQWEKSDFEGAEALYQLAFEIRSRLLGDHRDTAAALLRCGVLLVRAGRYDDAGTTLGRALDMQRRVLGANHPELADTLLQLAEVYSHRADFNRAEATTREGLAILERLYPDGHKRVADVLTDLASALEAKGRLREASDVHRRAMAMEARTTPDGKTSLSFNNYGVFLTTLGRPKEALPYARTVLRDWMGDGHTPTPGRAYASQNLGLVLLELDHLDEAEALLKAADDIWRVLFGDAHSKRSNALVSLGRVAEWRGDRESAKRYYRQAVDIRQKRLGPDHPDKIVAQLYLLRVESEEGAPVIADVRKLVDRLRERVGETHQNMAFALLIMAQVEDATCDDVGAESHYGQSAEVLRSLDLGDHPHLAECLVGLAELALARGDAREAADLLTEAVRIRTECFEPGDARTAQAQNRLAAVRARANREP